MLFEDRADAGRRLADALVCLSVESDFGGVGQFYGDFRQIEDDDVIAMLAEQS